MNIQKLLMDSPITMQELSRRIGVDSSYLSKIKYGKSKCGLDVRVKIVRFFNEMARE